MMPKEHQYKILHEGVGGKVLRLHHLAELQNEADLIRKIEIGKQLVDLGHKVDILPELKVKNNNDVETIELRKQILPGVIGKKNPEYKIDDIYADLKNPEAFNFKKFRKALKHYSEQSTWPVVDFNFEVNKADVEYIAQTKVDAGGKIEKVYIFYNDNTNILINKKS
jgi:hypothetical protein